MKVGNYSIPDNRLFPKLLKHIEELYKIYRLEEAEDENSVAQVCGHKSANSGAWINKKADFRLYGLMEPRALQLTPLAQALAYGTVKERMRATHQAILNVDLWEQLYNRFGPSLPESNFWVQLQRIAGLDPLDAQNLEDKVRKAYLDDISHVQEAEGFEAGYKAPDVPNTSQAMSVSGWSINIQVGPYTQTLPYTKDGLKLVKGFIHLLEAQLENDESIRSLIRKRGKPTEE